MGVEAPERTAVKPDSAGLTGVRLHTRMPVTPGWLARHVVPGARALSERGTPAVQLRRGWLHGPHVDVLALALAVPGGPDWTEVGDLLDAGPLDPPRALTEEAYLERTASGCSGRRTTRSTARICTRRCSRWSTGTASGSANACAAPRSWVTTAPGSPSRTAPVRDAEVVVGADGIHSTVRETFLRDEPVFAGLGIYRGLVPVDRLPDEARAALVRLWLGPGGHFVCYPVSGGRHLSFAATVPMTDAPPESWSAPGDPEELRRAFGSWTGLVADIVEAVDVTHQWAPHDRPPLRQWSSRHITLLGDAAHPMLPFMAQGANQAIEDAMDLVAGLAAPTDEPTGTRRPRRPDR
ncbi:FAD-dependent monooxygenase [Streptomyces sp. NBC_00009]|uniref:FAD-dependent monooxygenase n=1 Tax=Streptomyces sp. NBC_00009 TaxID=2975620 RepID=UPI003246FC1C